MPPARGARPRERAAADAMTTLIIGGGLMGVTTAWALLERGEAVTVLEGKDGVALDTSYANGGLLTPSMPEPWNGPGVFRHLLASLFQPRSPMKLRLRAVPSLTGWGLRFLRYSARRHHEPACRDNYRLARYSLDRNGALTERLDLAYDRGTAGTLSIFRESADFAAKEAVCRLVAPLGMRYSVLGVDDIVARVPALGDIRDELYNGILYDDDEWGDAHRFCRGLAEACRRAGGGFEFGCEVTGIAVDGDRVSGVSTRAGRIEADRVVVAAGAASPALLRPAGYRLPVRPVKGYSVTVDLAGVAEPPPLPVIDDSMHAGLTPLGTRLRMVGTAEFTGFDRRIDRVRTDNLYRLFERTLPSLAARVDPDSATPWAGLRPVSCDGKPVIGAVGPRGLYVNSGHGPLGWTMATGSAELLADLVTGARPALDPAPYAPGRFA